MAKVTKAVIAAAGFGTRFLPQTKAMPKEMLPLVDKPIIQFIVEELVAAGVQDIIIVTGYSKRSIEDHFDTPNEELLQNLRAGGPKKAHYITELERIADMANFAYVRQKGPYGTATPLLNVAHLIGDEPFFYLFADDVTVAQPNAFKQMIDLHQELGGSILPCIRIHEDSEFSRYGVLGGEQLRPDVLKMNRIVEKPGRATAPSDFASVGGYLLEPAVLRYLERAFRDFSGKGEFHMTDFVLQPMIEGGEALFGCEIKNSVRYDTGKPLEYLKAVVEFALQRQDIGEDFRKFLSTKLS